VIVAPEACCAAIEVKATLSAISLREALENLDSLMQFFPDRPSHSNNVMHRSIFAFAIDGKLRFPSSVFNGLNASYSQSRHISMEERIAYSRNEDDWHRPWISSVSVLGIGNINCDLWPINDDGKHVVHVAYVTGEDAPVDAYGFLERKLLLELIVGKRRDLCRYMIPELTKLLFSSRAERSKGKWYMPVERIKVTKAGPPSEDWTSQVFIPRKPKLAENKRETTDGGASVKRGHARHARSPRRQRGNAGEVL
jgi:hypothetical protein